MQKKTKIWLISAFLLIMIGGILFGGAMHMLNWDFAALSTDEYQTEIHTIQEDFSSISIRVDTADVIFVNAGSEAATVTCHMEANITCSVRVTDGMLLIESEDHRKWYEHIGIHFGTPKVTVSIPQGQYADFLVKTSTGDVQVPGDFAFERITIGTSTGDIRLDGVTADSLDLTVSTGRVTVSDSTCGGDLVIRVTTGKTVLSDIRCRNLSSTGDTGKITLQNVIATEKITVARSTGDVSFDRCDATELSVSTDTGDVRGSLLSEKVFIAAADTGKIDVPNTVTGGKCQITTDTGDIVITIEE